MTTGKTIALTRWTFVGEVMSLLLNMLSRLDISFLSRSKHLLISWLQSTSAVILEPPKIKIIERGLVADVANNLFHDVFQCHETRCSSVFVNNDCDVYLLAVQGTRKSSQTPQFKSINPSVLSFLYSPTLTSIHDYWKNHSFD